MSFTKLKKEELLDIAENSFAVEVNEDMSKPEIIAAMAESGVTYDMYAAQNKQEEPEDEPQANVVTSQQMQPVDDEEPVEEKIVVKEEVPLHTKEKWLIKMVRANPLYEVRGHRFTQENPFALVTPDDAEYLLTREEGFRQATPSELSDYYG